MMQVDLLSAGAALGLVNALRPRFAELTGAEIRGTFSAVGAIRERFDAGDPCDVLVLTDAMLRALARDGAVDAGSVRALGHVRTGIAVRSRDRMPAIDTPDALRTSLLAGDALYMPDPERATAGIHFMRVLDALGIATVVAPRVRAFPNGATAMRELARDTSARPIGCTQVTEIRYTEGVQLVGVLPKAFELATVYAAAVSTRAQDRALAARLVDLLTGDASREVRERGGFEAA